MKSSILLSAVALLIANNSFAQIHNEQVQQSIHWAKNMADKLTRSKFDSTYVAAPEHKLMVFVNANYGYNKFNQDIPFPTFEMTEAELNSHPDMPKLNRYLFRLHQNAVGGAVGISYGSVRAKYTFNIGNRNEKQFMAEALGSRFGFMIDYRRSKKMEGTTYDALNGAFEYQIDPTLSAQELLDKYTSDIPSDRNDFTSIHLQGHYVVNYRRFSYSAARTATRIQKKSAGSPLLLADFYKSKARFQESLLLGDSESFSTWKASLGAGYAYSYTPNRGKVLLHASVIPSVSLVGNSTYRTNPVSEEWYMETLFYLKHEGESYPSGGLNAFKEKYPEEYKENYSNYLETVASTNKKQKEYSDVIGKTPKVTLNCTARVAATWNITEHYVLGAYGSYQYSNYVNKARYAIHEHKLSAQVFVGYRF